MRLMVILCLIAGAHAIRYVPSEPFYNNDETRHVMTGVFFRDFFVDLPLSNPRDYAIEYYANYPALGLLIWPPMFHTVLGACMYVFGISPIVAKSLTLGFGMMACYSFFRIVLQTHGREVATASTLILGLSPLVFNLSSYVMLEIPTLAFSLAGVDRFLRYLDRERAFDLFLASAFCSMAVLTRFDGFYLGPTLLIIAFMRVGRRWKLFIGVDGFLASLLALVLVVPVYLLIIHQTGGVHQRAIVEGTSPGSSSPFHPRNLIYYLSNMPSQMGWLALGFALIGLANGLRPSRIQASWPYLAMILSTLAMIMGVAELETRHAVYLSPSLALFSATGIHWIVSRLKSPRAFWIVAAAVIAGTSWTTSRTPSKYVVGYEAAAHHVVANTKESSLCLFDSYLNGDFIYQIRRLDPSRRFCILRGDKLLYNTLSDARTDYREFVHDKAEVLDTIDRYDPEYLVVEDPPVDRQLRIAGMLCEVLRENPKQFQLESTIPIDSNLPMFQGISLKIYRKTVRSNRPSRILK